jgi:hypothetical protein
MAGGAVFVAGGGAGAAMIGGGEGSVFGRLAIALGALSSSVAHNT